MNAIIASEMPGLHMNSDNRVEQKHPWDLVWGQPYIDTERLCAAIELELSQNLRPDFRTRLLIRDSIRALEAFWEAQKLNQWLTQTPVKARIEAILTEKLGDPGFHNIRSRLVTNIKREQLEQVFELLGRKIQHAVNVYIAGSVPTLIDGLTARPTDKFDFVDEVPAEIRDQRELIEQIGVKYGLTLGHVQSHYLPDNWKERAHSLGNFGKLRVHLVDSYDIFVSKLSSTREKHQEDIRVLAPGLDKDKARQRLLTDGKAFLESASQRSAIETNWQFIYRESLLGGEDKLPPP